MAPPEVRMFSNVSPIGDKCQYPEANLTHSFTTCIKITNFWLEIFKVISNVVNKNLVPDSKLIILGILERDQLLTTAQRTFIDYSLIIGKKLILQFWKGPTPPTIKLWISGMAETLHLERIRLALLGKLDQFNLIWSPFLEYLKGPI